MRACGALAVVACALPALAQHYKQTNLVSDQPGVAGVTDSNLVNPWGLSRSSGSPWWESDNGTGLSTLISGTGTPASLVVTVPTGDPNVSSTERQPGQSSMVAPDLAWRRESLLFSSS